jgi:hypothetical protein
MLDILDDFIYSSPWLSLSIFVLAGIIGSGMMLFVTTRLVHHDARYSHNEFTMFMVTNIAVFYAVLLAFIAIAAWDDLKKAQATVENEASLVQSLYLDSKGLHDKTVVDTLRGELRYYVDLVIAKEWPEQQKGHASHSAEFTLHDIRMTLAAFEPKTLGDTVVMQEMMRGLNELFTAYHARREGAAGHIPGSIWWAICFLGLLTVGFTAFLRMRSPGMHFFLVAGFTTTIVIVVSLIAQLDYPFRGEISVPSDPLEHALSALNEPAAAEASAH